MSIVKNLSVGLLSFVATGAFAEDAPWLFYGSSTAGTADLTAAKWSNDGGTTKEAPQAGRHYVVKGSYACTQATTGGDVTFAGESLSIGDGTNAGTLASSGAKASATWTFSDLIFNNKGVLKVGNNNGTLTIAGKVTVNAGQTEIQHNAGYATPVDVLATLNGSGDLLVRKIKNYESYKWPVRLKGDASGYSGTMTVGQSGAYNANRLMIVLFGDAAPRKAAVNPSGLLGSCEADEDYSGVVNLDELTLAADSTLCVKVTDATNTLFRVKTTYSAPAQGVVKLDLQLPDENAVGRRVPILSVPTGQGLDAKKFAFRARSDADACRSAACSLVVEPNGQGQDVLVLVIDKYTYAIKNDAYKESCWKPEFFSHWKTSPTGDTLDPDTVYLSYNKQLYPPTGGGVNTFAGKRWVFGSGSSKLTISNGYLIIDDLVLLDGADVRNASSGPDILGNIRLGAPQGGEWGAVMTCSGGWAGTISSKISGDSGLSVVGANKVYTLYLYGDNSNLSGKIKVATNANSPLTNMTVVVTNACALGGAMADFTYDGVSLQSWSQLRVSASTAFDEPTRGLFVSGAGIVDVQKAADTFTLASQTTLAGELVKKGNGTLALGGTLKFTAGQQAEPLAGTNVLTVSAGRIRPASKAGANGLAIAFAANTGLRFAPLAETDADVTKYGLYDVAWATPFDLTGTEGRLNVAVDVPSGTKEPFSFGICTVSEGAADALDGKIDIPTIKGLKQSVVREPAVDGAVTFRADYARPGMMLIFR